MIQFQIQGMRCSGCAGKITQAIPKRDASAVVMGPTSNPAASASPATSPPLRCGTSFRRSATAWTICADPRPSPAGGA